MICINKLRLCITQNSTQSGYVEYNQQLWLKRVFSNVPSFVVFHGSGVIFHYYLLPSNTVRNIQDLAIHKELSSKR